MSSETEKTSLADAVEANALGENTCRIVVTTPLGRGLVFVAKGAVVDAVYGTLSGPDAFYALINAADARFAVNTGISTGERRIRSSVQALILKAMTLRFEGKLPVPLFPGPSGDVKADTLPIASDEVSFAQIVADAVPAAPVVTQAPIPIRIPGRSARPGSSAGRPRISAIHVDPPRTKPSPSSPRRAGILLAASVLVLGAMGVLFVTKPHAAARAGAGTPAPAPHLDPVEFTELTGSRDELPAFISGVNPRSPDPGSALSPTIVCRILVDERGFVREARIFRSRLDLAAFEDAALTAVRGFTFKPARRAGRPVPVWINWPIEFK